MVLHTPQTLVSRSREDDHCALLYTGGTTGKPKGVLHTHRVMVAMVQMQMADFDWPNLPRFLAMTPITHAAGALIPPVLMRSGTVIMHAGFDVKTFCSLVEKHRVNCTFMVPTMIYVLLDSPARQDHDLSSLETLIYGAASMAPARLIEGIAELGPIFMQLYGQSEAPMAMTVLHKHEHDPVNHPQRLSSCGTPVVGIQLDLLDEDGQPVQTGEVGEICVRGPLVMQEYINKPKENAQAFRHGWLYSGDLARRDADGYLYIVDRSKDMIISGGFNVYPREIEDVLSTHPSVAAVAVVGVPHDKWGEAVHAVVVWRAGQSADWGELAEQVRAKKGAIHVPKYFHAVDHLLTTGLGKVDKKAIRQQVQNLP
jgi:fatty-acyl-CoA synthase